MASFLFADKSSDKQEFQNKTAGRAFVIHTMQDDLEGTTNEELEPPKAKFSSPAEQKTNIPIAATTPPVPDISPSNETSEKEKTEENLQNPFGVVSDVTTQQPTPLPLVKQPVTEMGLASSAPEGSILVNQKSSGHKKLWISLFIIIFFLLAIIGSVWYFLLNGERQFDYKKYQEKIKGSLFLSNSNDFSNAVKKISDIPEMLKKDPEAKPEFFSSDKPNYLPFDTEIVSPKDIRATFSQIASRIQEARIKKPVEFLITDYNNNPLALSRFVFLFNLDLDSDMLTLAKETFSLYAYNDDGVVRLGLVLEFDDIQMETVADIIAKTESRLPYTLRALILQPNVDIGEKLVFQSSNYDQFSIRFANINIDKKIAIDYTLYKNQFFVGTSKNTLRAMLDANVKSR